MKNIPTELDYGFSYQDSIPDLGSAPTHRSEDVQPDYRVRLTGNGMSMNQDFENLRDAVAFMRGVESTVQFLKMSLGTSRIAVTTSSLSREYTFRAYVLNPAIVDQMRAEAYQNRPLKIGDSVWVKSGIFTQSGIGLVREFLPCGIVEVDFLEDAGIQLHASMLQRMPGEVG